MSLAIRDRFSKEMMIFVVGEKELLMASIQRLQTFLALKVACSTEEDCFCWEGKLFLRSLCFTNTCDLNLPTLLFVRFNNIEL